MEVALVRYGEISLKSDRVRKRMEKLLMKNLEAQTGGKAFKKASRILVVGGNWEEISRVFGVVSWSPSIEVRADIEEIKEVAVELMREERGTFKVEAQRVTKDFPLTSLEINKVVGAEIVEKVGLKVDVKSPNVILGIEIVGNRAYLFKEVKRGPGGLPVGSEGRAVLLFSGGIDSPVAGWMVGKRGVSIYPLHAYMGVDVSPVLEALGKWFPYTLRLKTVTIDRNKIIEVLKREGRTGYFYLVVKALIYRAGERYARDVGADAIVTGESIGQVSSQTLRNLRALDEVVNITVLRPLSGLNKEEIVSIAKKIGTYDASTHIPEPCARIKFKPVVRADPEVLRDLVEEVEG